MTRFNPAAALPNLGPPAPDLGARAAATRPSPARSSAARQRTSKQYTTPGQQNNAANPAYCHADDRETQTARRAVRSQPACSSTPSSTASATPAAPQRQWPSRPRQRALVAVALACLAALVATPSQAQAVGPVSQLVVTQTGQGPADHGCASFRLSAKQAQAFFKRAVLITERQNHDHFDRGPCTVSGSFKTRFDTWQWEIRNGGTAAIMSSNGDSFLLADPRQASPANP